jgi:hypothetical protein
MITSHEHYDIMVISLDLAVDYQRCDLSQVKNRDFWRGQVYSGRIIAAMMGPPCETFSTAREQPVPDRPNAPRPLRSRQLPWGLERLKKREINQLFLSNVLLTFAIDVTVALLATKGMSVSEHPATPISETAASKWRLVEIQALLKSPAVEMMTFRQGTHGAGSAKPTTLLALRMPSLRKYLYKPQIPLDPERDQNEKLIGLDGAGRFKTAKSKEYPASMCMAIAKAMRDNIQQHFRRGQPSVPGLHNSCDKDDKQSRFLRDFVVAHDAYEDEGDMMADYMSNNKTSEWQ